MRASYLTVLILGVLALLAPRLTMAEEGTEDLAALGTDIGHRLTGLKVGKVAVAEFVGVDGGRSNLGKLISEEVTTSLFNVGGLVVVERSLLEGVLNELTFQLQDLVDPTTAQSVGALLGVDAILVGSYADMADTVRVNARIVSVESGTVVAAAAASVRKTEGIRRLLAGSTAGSPAPSTAGSKKQDTAGLAGAVFFEETFDGIEEGDVPKGWGGVEHLAVFKGTSESYLAAFEPGSATIRIPNVPFPENYRIEISSYLGSNTSLKAEFLLLLGDLTAGFQRDGRPQLCGVIGSSSTERLHSLASDRTYLLAIEKQGSIVKLFIDGEQVLVARQATLRAPREMLIAFYRRSDQTAGRIYSIKGIDLGD